MAQENGDNMVISWAFPVFVEYQNGDPMPNKSWAPGFIVFTYDLWITESKSNFSMNHRWKIVVLSIETKPPVIYVIWMEPISIPKCVAPIWSWPWEIPQLEWMTPLESQGCRPTSIEDAPPVHANASVANKTSWVSVSWVNLLGILGTIPYHPQYALGNQLNQQIWGETKTWNNHRDQSSNGWYSMGIQPSPYPSDGEKLPLLLMVFFLMCRCIMLYLMRGSVWNMNKSIFMGIVFYGD